MGPNSQRQLVFGGNWPQQKLHQRHVSRPEKAAEACAPRKAVRHYRDRPGDHREPPEQGRHKLLGCRAGKNADAVRTAFVATTCSRNPAAKTAARRRAARRYFGAVAAMNSSCRPCGPLPVTGNDTAKLSGVSWAMLSDGLVPRRYSDGRSRQRESAAAPSRRGNNADCAELASRLACPRLDSTRRSA